VAPVDSNRAVSLLLLLLRLQKHLLRLQKLLENLLQLVQLLNKWQKS